MLKVIYRASAVHACLLFVVCLFYNQVAVAQVAPTNSATISGSVSDSTGNPVANAKVSLSGPKNISMQTDSYGLFVFIGVPFGSYQISTAATGLGTATRNISVQGDTNVAIQYEPASSNGLKVIAQVSSVANAQFNVTAASITHVNPIANAFEGKTSWRTIFEQIPGVSEAGLVNGATNRSSTVDSPIVPMQIAINGALPYETATLFDDMPLIGAGAAAPAGSGTDLSLYPLNGFDSADVVRGPGAGAPSIVDSIGGSFLLQAPGMVNKDHYNFSVSNDPYGGIVTNGLAAVRWNKLSAVVTYGVNESPGPMSSGGIPLSTLFQPSTIDGSAFLCLPGSCAVTSAPAPPGFLSFVPGGTSVGFLQCCFNQSAGWSEHSGSVALTYALSPAVHASVYFSGTSTRLPNVNSGLTVADFTPPAGYIGDVLRGQHLFFGEGGTPTPTTQSSSLLEEKVTGTLGRGAFRIAALQNRTWNTFSETTPSSATVQLFGGGCIASSPGGTGGCPLGFAPEIFNGDTHAVTYFQFSLFEPLVTNNRDFLLGYTTPLGENFRAGASFVKSFYNNDELINLPAFGLHSQLVSPQNTQTTNELRVFVGGNPSAKTTVDLSLYAVDANYHVQNPNNAATFTDARSTYTAPRLGFVWRPTATVAVRAAAGGGFAEAPLGDLIGSNSQIPIPNGSPATSYSVSLENLNLQPEKSFAFDLGADIQLHRNTTVSFDVYRATLYGQVYSSTSPIGLCNDLFSAGLCTGGNLEVLASQFRNLGKSRYEGVLVDVHHDTISHGMYWSFAGGLTRGFIVSLPAGFYNTAGGVCNPTTGANCNFSTINVLPNINFNGTFAATIPYSQGLGTLGYRWTPQKYVDVVATYFGNNNTYFRPAFVEFDGNIGYPLRKDASLLVTFRNITGIYDNPLQVQSLDGLSGAPTITGQLFPIHGEMYGPRTVILTLNWSLP